ncbi:phosphomevalonate kinase, ERG8 [Artemisia annua]|uniref:phosphomevalonate kinase n=1 Tax=Artemisia annua TaxID=35608 RepID=A0A2U1L7V9_ARTAN|nr:phosphomevalonate kinase, ERG8 [Artemisia annua]
MNPKPPFIIPTGHHQHKSASFILQKFNHKKDIVFQFKTPHTNQEKPREGENEKMHRGSLSKEVRSLAWIECVSIEPFIRNVAEKHRIDYQLTGLPNREFVEGEPMSGYEQKKHGLDDDGSSPNQMEMWKNCGRANFDYMCSLSHSLYFQHFVTLYMLLFSGSDSRKRIACVTSGGTTVPLEQCCVRQKIRMIRLSKRLKRAPRTSRKFRSLWHLKKQLDWDAQLNSRFLMPSTVVTPSSLFKFIGSGSHNPITSQDPVTPDPIRHFQSCSFHESGVQIQVCYGRIASAPGKVLITGGYLVLERPNAGIVLSTNARFYAIVKPLYDELRPDSWLWSWTDLKLTSPQMGREAMYKMSLKHFTLQCTSRQIEARGLPLTPASLASLPPFTSITFNSGLSNGENSKPEVAKTGLGSSAAMTTAVVAALLNYLGVVNLSSYSGAQHQENLDVVHIIAQTAHCMAQGKVGSGFDVSSAVYGSHRYVRFSPEVISSAQNAIRALPLEDVIGDVLKGKWDHERTKFSLPPLMNLLLGEPGTGGSSTPSMVGAVKNWQKSDPQKSLDTWRQLSVANTTLEHQLNMLSKLAEEHWDTYNGVIYSCSMHQSDKWIEQASEAVSLEIVKALHGARDAMLNIRCHMREMGKAAGIPIEPESQTQLLDATMNMPGVLLAGVPGAGGFDAVFAVTLGDSGNNLINTWSSHKVLALLIEPESQTQLLDATMNMPGVLLAGVPGAGGFDAVFAVTLGDSGNNLINAWSSHKVLALLVREDPRGVSLENADPRTNQITSGISSVRIV